VHFTVLLYCNTRTLLYLYIYIYILILGEHSEAYRRTLVTLVLLNLRDLSATDVVRRILHSIVLLCHRCDFWCVWCFLKKYIYTFWFVLCLFLVLHDQFLKKVYIYFFVSYNVFNVWCVFRETDIFADSFDVLLENMVKCCHATFEFIVFRFQAPHRDPYQV